MALQYQNVSFRNFGRGIDQRSIQNALTDGYVESAVNIDTNSSGHASKRPGYQGYYGNVPFRVASVNHNGTTLTLSFDGSIDMQSQESTPIVVYGKLGNPDNTVLGDLSTSNTVNYYPGFTTSVPDTLPAGPNTFTLQGARYEAQYGTPLVTTLLSTSTVDKDNEWIVPQSVLVDETSPFDISIITNLPSQEQSFIYATDLAGVGGEDYVHTFTLPHTVSFASGSVTTGATTTIASATHTLIVGDTVTIQTTGTLPAGMTALTEYTVTSIVAGVSFTLAVTTTTQGTGTHSLQTVTRTSTVLSAVHNLSTYNIVEQVWIDEGTSWEQVFPESFTVDVSTGAVTVVITISDSSTKTCHLVMASVGVSQNLNLGSFTGNQTFTLAADFVHFGVYSVVGSTYSEALPNSLTHSDDGDSDVINLTNPSLLTHIFIYKPAIVQTNALVLEDSASASYNDDSPQLTVWGLDHLGAYNSDLHGGEVVEIDAYKRTAEQRLVVGLGGNLYAARSIDEVGDTYNIPEAAIQLQNRLTAASLGPAFAYGITADNTELSTSTDLWTISAGHNFEDGDTVRVSLISGSFPSTGSGSLSSTINYYIVNATDTTFQLSETSGGTPLDLVANPTGSYSVFLATGRTFSTIASTVSRTGYATVTAITYTGTPGRVTYTFSDTVPTAGLQGSSGGSTIPDYLTVTNASNPIHNGTFKIYSSSATTITITNANVFLSDFDETASSASAGVFTDKLTVSEPVEFFADDLLNSSDFTLPLTVIAVKADTKDIRVSGVTAGTFPTTGSLVTVTRITDIIPLASAYDFVKGDMLEVDGYLQEMRIKHVNAVSSVPILSASGAGVTAAITTKYPHHLSNGNSVVITGTSVSGLDGTRTITSITSTTFTVACATSFSIGASGLVNNAVTSITQTGSLATVTTSSPHQLLAGDRVLLASTKPGYDGAQTIVEVLSSTTFTFASTDSTGASSGFLRGSTIELDEVITASDDGETPTMFTVVGRWIPVEIPTTADTLPANTAVRHWTSESYDNQDIMRSAMVSDNMYFVNSEDQVYKFDGESLYQAGLPRWQPQLFVNIDTTAPTIPELPAHTYSSKSQAAGAFNFTATNPGFSIGDRIVDEADNAVYTVQSLDLVNFKVFVSEPISSATASSIVRKVRRYKYYFRLNAIDANNNVIASAVSGQEDFVVEMQDAGTINMRLVGLPPFTYLDYDRIEAHVYRTPSNVSGLYALDQIIDMTFNNGTGYVDIVDGRLDDEIFFQGSTGLIPVTADNPHATLLGAELGVTWTQPTRAKYCTSLDNRLVLANIKDYSQLDFTLRKKASVGSFTPSDLVSGTPANNVLLFRRDSTDTATTTNMVNRVGYQFFTTANSITPATDITDTSSLFTVDTGATPPPAEGDWVYLFHSSQGLNKRELFAGWWQVSEATTGPNTFTVIFPHTVVAASASNVNRWISSTHVPVWLGVDGNYNQFGTDDIDEEDVVIRLANAINASQRMTNQLHPGQESFVPWLFAQAGSELGLGRLLVRQETVAEDIFGTKLPTYASTVGFSWYVQGLLAASATSYASTVKVFPSRVVVSYPNFPEIFDNPFGEATDSDSIIDINSSDGQEITGVIPFFGESFTSTHNSALESTLIVFKTNSVYAVDISTKEITKLQTRGLGCTAPFSIAMTKDGILFANESGVYMLDRSQALKYGGKYIERLWQDRVNKTDLSRVTGHHYSKGNKYKLSVPIDDANSTRNSGVLVYDHQAESQEQEYGAWTEYNNHPVTGWCNLINDAFFGATSGRVFKIRALSNKTDYRDDDQAITSELILRGIDFDQAGVRKAVASIVSHLQLRHSPQTVTEIYNSVDLTDDFALIDTISAQLSEGKVIDRRSSVPERKQLFSQVKYINAVKDEEFILAGIDYYVGLLNNKGVREQRD